CTGAPARLRATASRTKRRMTRILTGFAATGQSVRRTAMQIRHARTGDEPNLAALLDDHERHYGNEVAPKAAAAGAAFLTGRQGGTLCLVADDGSKLVGFAILNPYFPGPNLTHGLYLKELYVAQAARSLGVGEKLIDGIRELARKRGDARV